MKINSIAALNFLGLSQINMDLSSHTLHLVAGHNAAGKSSLKNALGFAFGDSGRVALKGEYQMMVRDGAKAGSVQIITDSASYQRDVASGKLNITGTASTNEFLPFALDLHKFGRLNTDDRRALLTVLMRATATPQRVTQLLAARGLPDWCINAVLHDLNSGIAAAHAAAKERLRDCKAEWKAVTGETWGIQKAEGWAVTTPDAFDPEEMARLEGVLATIDAELEQAQQKYGALQEKARQVLGQAAKRAELDMTAKGLAKKKDLLERAQKELGDYTTEVRQVEAQIEAGSGHAYTCPCCQARLAMNSAGDALEEAPAHDFDLSELTALLDDKTEALRMLTRARDNRKRDYDTCLAANDALVAMGEVAAVSEVDVQAAKDDVLALKSDWTEAQRALHAQQDAKRAIDSALAKTEQARDAHAAAKVWSAMEAALAPDGIPAELLASALDPFNARLQDSAQTTGWPCVLLDADMLVTAGGRDCRLLSESEQWRVDAMLTEAVAFFAGLRLLVLDRVDVLIPANRPALFKWLLAIEKDYDTQLLLCSTKERPTLPASVKVWWLEQGQVA